MWHKLDENSPLWPKRDSLQAHLEGVEVSVSAFDVETLQYVMFFKRYEKEDLVMDAVFENTLSSSGNPRSPTQLQADHRLLDKWVPEAAPIRRAVNKKKRRSSVTKTAIRAALGGSLGEHSTSRRRRKSFNDESAGGNNVAEERNVIPVKSRNFGRWLSRREEVSESKSEADQSEAISDKLTVSV